jgi:benzoylformate decarboxylase
VKLSDAVLEILRTEGVDRVFGNPGTTELPLVDRFVDVDDLAYVLGVHEGPLVAMADGYARATRRPAFVNLHVAAGTANGMIGMLNALRSRVPLVVLAGQQDSRHLVQEPMLAGDLVGLAAAACKSAVEARRPEEVPLLLRRAFREAVAAPAGPVFVSVPMDFFEQEVGQPPPASHLPEARPVHDLTTAVAMLREASSPALVAGDGISRSTGVAHAVRLADALGATVYGAPMFDHLNFPMDHAAYAGMLPPDNAQLRNTLDGHDVVLLAGVRGFAPHHYSPQVPVGPATRLVQVDEDAATVGRTYPVALGIVGDVGDVLAGLADVLGASEHAPSYVVKSALGPVPVQTTPLEPATAAAVVAGSLPTGTVLVEESITTGLLLRERLRLTDPGTFEHTVGGGLGWGIGAAVGLALGHPGRRVVAALGDGCALFGLQGLWTAGHEQVPTTFVVFANGEYRTLKQTLTSMREGRELGFVGMDLDRVDWPQLSASLGVPGVTASDSGHLARLLTGHGPDDGPLLVEVPIQGFSR